EAGKFNTRVLTPSAPGAATPPLAGAGKAAPAKSEAPIPGAAPKDAPAAAKTAPPAAPGEGNAPSVLASAKKEPPPPAKDQARAARDESDAARARALLEGKETCVVQLAVFSKQANVKKLRDKLTAVGVKTYTEAARGPNGERTRVCAGPFDSKLEAEQAHEKIAAMGIRPKVAAQ
ncbi:MAG: hypothetical protein A2V78_15050, partial [Betaproteobacteria bacterium RBG_16_64_18]